MSKKDFILLQPKNKKIEHRIRRLEDRKRMEETDLASYIDEKSIIYGINRNIARDIPSMMDGLTPVERRMLYSMFCDGLSHKVKRERVATIIGSTIERVYPHGDGPLDQTNARIGRHWNMMIPYLDGEGNFGDMQTKKAAGMRYRKARLSEYAWDCFFSETDKNNPNFDVKDNYNYSGVEPIWLPTKYPNILMQWNTGIGIGISSNIGAFNTKELLEATIRLIDDADAKIDLYPDTPLPLFITNKKALKGCFDKNSFTLETEAPYEVEIQKKASGEDIVFVIFKSVSISASIESIEAKIKDIKKSDETSAVKKLKEVKDVIISVSVGDTKGRKEKSPEDTKKLDFFIQCEKGYDPHMVAQKILSMTQFGISTAVSYNVVHEGALVQSTPRGILLEWIDNRISQKYRIIQQELARLFYDILIAEGMLKIHGIKDGVDKFIKIVRFHKGKDGKAATRAELVEELVSYFKLNPKQAEYILRSDIASLSSLSIKELEEHTSKLRKRYDELSDICNDDDVKKIIKEELEEGIKKYGAPRNATFKNKQEIKVEDLYLVYSDKGYYCVSDLSYKMEVDKSYSVCKFNTEDHLVIFYKNGTVLTTSGMHFKELLDGSNSAMLVTETHGVKMLDIIHIYTDNKKNKFVTIATKNGFIKMLEYKDITKKSSTSIIKLEQGDEVSAVRVLTDVSESIFGFNMDDQMYYCTGEDIPLQKRGSSGTKIFKKAKSQISSISQINRYDEFIIMYGDSGYVKILDAAYLSTGGKKNDYISMMGKNIKGVVSFKNKGKISLYELTGEIEIRIEVKGDEVFMYAGDKVSKIKLSSTIGASAKLFKKSKNELYEIHSK